jgi:predicted transcriptional regulator
MARSKVTTNGRKPREWNPTPRQLEIYDKVVEGRLSQAEIGRQYKISQQAVSELSLRVAKWLLPQWMDHIRELKVMQSARLMKLYHSAVASYVRSTDDAVEELEESSEHPKSVTKRKSQAGDAAFIGQARGALSDIRKIWGVETPIEVVDDSDRVAGKKWDDVVKARIDTLQGALKRSQN